ncbi:hypothetical protein [Flavobacterium sp.]|uniref:hypothetical protein n=1 Tax=Flavobacterium sp. TaxID=239 RepID=UPI0033423E57
MTPKEKAKELVDKYCYAIRTEETDSQYWTNIIHAKQCALIAVDEILNIDNIKPYILHKEIIEFYKEVKQEIEKL